MKSILKCYINNNLNLDGSFKINSELNNILFTNINNNIETNNIDDINSLNIKGCIAPIKTNGSLENIILSEKIIKYY